MASTTTVFCSFTVSTTHNGWPSCAHPLILRPCPDYKFPVPLFFYSSNLKGLSLPAANRGSPLVAKATPPNQNTKPNSIGCSDCYGNGAIQRTQFKGTGVNSVGHFNRQFKLGFYVGSSDAATNNLVSNLNRRRNRVVVSSFVRGKPGKRQVVVPEPDYRIPLVLLGFAGAFGYQNSLLAAAPVGLLGLLLFFQATRVRFVFDDETLEVKVGNRLEESGENVFVGGKNRWRYSTFVNWEFWWPNFPVLVYFKETQTRPEGQVHFFPIIFNGKQLYDVMVERAGSSKTSGPKDS